MDHRSYWRFWIPVSLIVLIPLIYSVLQYKNMEYWPSFMGNWAATTIGVVLGIPIALEISRRQQVAE
jgi:hypothetical protein